ncbi:MAG TPA: TetR/AcrR family transcriptional regulator C-terminal domain-containing protein [Solirubrobacteraceae bacterium]|nr:TetR/AcrR family transcriptional regulator C-terminal domain-containing protein [Solirubrobacteraceae bacterium]
MSGEGRRRGPGRPAQLSRPAVVAAAQRIVARGGPEGLTMRRVADELGSSPMSVYRHVRDKDELLVLVLDELAAAIPRPPLPAEPRERLLAACRLLHAALLEHPWVVDVLARGDLIAPSVLWLMEEIVAGLVAGGLAPPAATDAYRALWQFTVGTVIIRRGLDRLSAGGRPPRVLDVLRAADPHDYPTLAALAGEWAAARERDTYDPGLEALVDGLLLNPGRATGRESGPSPIGAPETAPKANEVGPS